MEETLFRSNVKNGAPLADRMRPRTLDEFVGQKHIVGEGKLLRRAILSDRLQSTIFFGPPGTGKTTLASIIATSTGAAFQKLNAVSSGVKELRDGAMKLSDGLKELDEKGIGKITELMSGDTAERLKATVELAKEYRSFSGIADGMDGNVKFIYRTESVK